MTSENNKLHLSKQYNCWSLRYSRSITCRRCSNYIFILDLTPGFIGLGNDNCKMRQETFKFLDLVCLFSDVDRYEFCIFWVLGPFKSNIFKHECIAGTHTNFMKTLKGPTIENSSQQHCLLLEIWRYIWLWIFLCNMSPWLTWASAHHASLVVGIVGAAIHQVTTLVPHTQLTAVGQRQGDGSCCA